MLTYSQRETSHLNTPKSPSKPSFNRNVSLSHFPVSAPSVKTVTKNASDSLEPLFLDFFRTLAAINQKTTVDEVLSCKMELIVEILGMGTAGTGCLCAPDGRRWEGAKPLHLTPADLHKIRSLSSLKASSKIQRRTTKNPIN